MTSPEDFKVDKLPSGLPCTYKADLSVKGSANLREGDFRAGWLDDAGFWPGVMRHRSANTELTQAVAESRV